MTSAVLILRFRVSHRANAMLSNLLVYSQTFISRHSE